MGIRTLARQVAREEDEIAMKLRDFIKELSPIVVLLVSIIVMLLTARLLLQLGNHTWKNPSIKRGSASDGK